MKALREFIIRLFLRKKPKGVMTALPNKELVDINMAIVAEKLMRNGIDPRSLKNANQVENAIKMIDDRPAVQEGITSTESAKVFNIEGKELDPKKPIIGGTQTGKELSPELSERLRGTNVDRIKQKIADKKVETDAEIKARLDKDNKEGIAKIRARQKMLDDAIDNVSPGFSGDRKVDAELVAEELATRMGLVYDDLPTKQRLNLYDQAYTGLSKRRQVQRESLEDFVDDAGGVDPDDPRGIDDFIPDDDPEPLAQGGRAGFDNGGAPSIKLFPRARGREIEQEVGPGFKISERDIDYGITGLLQGDKFFGGAEIDKGKVKLDVVSPDGNTLFKDTISKPDAVNFILGMGDPRGNKFQVKTDKDFENMQITFNTKFNQGGRAGFFLGSANPRGLGLLRELLNFFGKKSDVIKNPSDVLRMSNPKAFNKMLEDAKGKVMPKEGIMATDKIKNYQTEMAKDRVEIVKDMLERGKRMKGADDKILAYQNDVKQRFMKDLNMSEIDAEKAAERMSTLAMDITKMEKTPKITDEGLLQLENVLKNMETGGKQARDLNADGGRIGFKDGMTRRTFLKIFGGLVSLPIVGKVLAPLKLTRGVSKVPIIKTDNVPGKPEWFDQLVNKVIIEGDDVTKRFATGERQSIHQKTLDDGSVVRVTEDVDDGAIRVEYESEANVFGDPVQLQYKKPLPDEGDPRPTAEFTTAESGPVGRSRGPDDYEIDVDEVGGTSIKDLDSDVSKLKEYATGQKPTMKEIVQNKKRRDKARDITEDPAAQADAVIARQGEYDGPYEDFASGGIARMLGE